MGATITIIGTEVDSLAQFRRLEPRERRWISLVGFEEFPSRSGRYPHSVLCAATRIELGIVPSPPDRDEETGEKLRSFIIDSETLERVLPRLAALVETNADATVRALTESVGETANLARVSEALATGAWPEVDDAAAEAAAFANNLLLFARSAILSGSGMCWEYRGEFALADAEV